MNTINNNCRISKKQKKEDMVQNTCSKISTPILSRLIALYLLVDNSENTDNLDKILNPLVDDEFFEELSPKIKYINDIVDIINIEEDKISNKYIIKIPVTKEKSGVFGAPLFKIKQGEYIDIKNDPFNDELFIHFQI